MGKRDKKIAELQYTIESLEEEVEDLIELLDDKQRFVVDLITENDRLTLAYEPYEPPKEKSRLRKWMPRLGRSHG